MDKMDIKIDLSILYKSKITFLQTLLIFLQTLLLSLQTLKRILNNNT